MLPEVPHLRAHFALVHPGVLATSVLDDEVPLVEPGTMLRLDTVGVVEGLQVHRQWTRVVRFFPDHLGTECRRVEKLV